MDSPLKMGLFCFLLYVKHFPKKCFFTPKDILKKFTVVSTNADTGQILTDLVVADNGMQAFLTAVVARKGTSIELVVAIEGEHKEDASLTFPGNSVVDAATVLEQPEVFGDKLSDSLVKRAAVGVTRIKNLAGFPYFLDMYFRIRDVLIEQGFAHYQLHLTLAKNERTLNKSDLLCSPTVDASLEMAGCLKSNTYLRSVLLLPSNLKLLTGEINRYCSVYGFMVSEKDIQELVLNSWFVDPAFPE